jgi:hypothetical protein
LGCRRKKSSFLLPEYIEDLQRSGLKDLKRGFFQQQKMGNIFNLIACEFYEEIN